MQYVDFDGKPSIDIKYNTGHLKYGQTDFSGGKSIWYSPNRLRIEGNIVTYTIRDGGLGDDDLSVNPENPSSEVQIIF